MKNLLLGLSFSLLASTAFAADAVVDDVVVVDAAYDWSGVYIGGALGWGSISGEDVGHEHPEADDGDLAGAIYVGYNFQMNNVVFGVEGDLNFRNAEVSDGFEMEPLTQNLGGSVRGRVGYAFDRILPYFTAGLAIAEFEDDHNGDGSLVASQTMTGYAVGAGIEWAATDNLVVRAQYLYSDFGTDDFDFDSDVHQFEVNTQDVLVGVAYKF